jgi:NADPH:quinone reductase
MDTHAIVIDGFDDKPHLVDVTVPDLEPDQVLVRVHAASVNAFDWKIADGRLRDSFEYDFPVTIGRDFAGVVERVGGDVGRVRVGDAVFGYFTGQRVHRGSYAQHVWCKEGEAFVAKPPEVTFLDAACLPLCGVIALRAFDAMAVREGDTILVLGAPGGVGSYAVQLAAGAGAHVIASGTAADVDYLRDLGAADVVEPGEGLVDRVRERHPDGVDGLIDLVSYQPAFLAHVELVRDGGHAASAHRAVDDGLLAARGITGTNLTSAPDRSLLERLGALAASGALRVPIQRTYSLEQAAEALVDLRDQHARGKFVLAIGDADGDRVG